MPGMEVRSDFSFSLCTLSGSRCEQLKKTMLLVAIQIMRNLCMQIKWMCPLIHLKTKKIHFFSISLILFPSPHSGCVIYSLVTSWSPQLFLLDGKWPAPFHAMPPVQFAAVNKPQEGKKKKKSNTQKWLRDERQIMIHACCATVLCMFHKSNCSALHSFIKIQCPLLEFLM